MTQPTRRKDKDRTLARLAAAQALYQMEVTGTDCTTVLQEFKDMRVKNDFNFRDDKMVHATFMGEIVRGVLAHQKNIDQTLHEMLSEGWSLPKLDPLLRAILRAASFELYSRKDIDTRVVISEYLDVTAAFYPPSESGFVNAVLDRVAKKFR